MVASRTLTREEQGILDIALLKSLKLVFEDRGGSMQDGMLAYYLSQAQASDVNVEARIEKEPFDYRNVESFDNFTGAPFDFRTLKR